MIYRGKRGFTVRSHKPDRVGSIPTPATIYWRVADLAKHVIVNHADVASNPSAPASAVGPVRYDRGLPGRKHRLKSDTALQNYGPVAKLDNAPRFERGE